MTKIVVVGGGLLGASVADELTDRGVDVTVVDGGVPGSGTSGSSFAWVNAQDKEPADYFALNAEGVAAYPALDETLGGDWYHPGGDIAIGRGPGAARLAARVERHRALGYAVRELDWAEVVALEPALELPADDELVAAHFPDDAWIDAPVLVERRLARAVGRGAIVRPGTPVSGFKRANGTIRAVRTASDEIEADAVVLAAGPATERLAAEAGVAVPMAPSPGLLATVRTSNVSLTHVIHAGPVAMRAAAGGGVVLSSREIDATLDASTRSMEPDAEPCRELLQRGGRILPALRGARVDLARIGVRSVATDGLPVAGFAPDIENLYVLVAHSGATLAPVLGRLVAAELTGETSQRLQPYRPARFSLAA